MKWTVVWTKNADDELADIWMAADDRAAVTSAAYGIENALRRNPEAVGEDYYGDRIYQFGCLAVGFEVHPDDRLVKVIQVIRIKGP